MIGESPSNIPENLFPYILQVASGRLKELNIYSKLVSKNMFLIVEDTFEEFYPKNFFGHLKTTKVRPETNKGNNPMTALKEFLKKNKNFSKNNEYNKK